MDQPAYQYKFSYANRKAWTTIINQAFAGKTGFAVVKTDAKTSISREMQFGNNDNLEKFLDMVPMANECTIQFGPMWTETLFWGVLPTIDAWLTSTIPVPDSTAMQRCQYSVGTILGNTKGGGFHEPLEHANVNIPFDHIKWIMCEVHKTHPVKKIYYSPSEPVVHVMFQSGSDYKITPNEITNSCDIYFDLNRGLSTAFPPKKTWSVEMEADFASWQQRQDTEIFKLR